MDNLIRQEILPTLIFFAAFCVVFSFLELLLILVLNILGRRYWEFVVDVIIRSKVHHGKVIRCVVMATLGIFLVAVVAFSPLVDILVRGTSEMRLFALVLALIIALFYSINIRKTAKMEVERKIYQCVFVVFSVLIYVVMLSAAEKSYTRYTEFVTTRFIDPAVEKVGHTLAAKEQERLLKKFREMNQSGLCPYKDYSLTQEVGIKNFVLIETEPALAYGEGLPDPNDPKTYLRGRVCSDEKDTFMLTEWGAWYRVVE